jgi:hypothetical protein
MRIAALIIGILGGLFGILSAVLALVVGGIGGSGTVVGLGWSALVFCILGFLGAGLAMGRPRLGALILLIAAIGITISVSWFAVIAAPLFLVAALLAFLGRRGEAERITVQTSGTDSQDESSRVR